MTDMATPRELDPKRLQHGGFMGMLGLIVSSWVGVIVGSILLSMTGVGALGAAALLMVGFVGVPVFGLLGGYVGLMRARDSAIANTRTKVLAADHPVTQMVAALARRMELPTPKVGIYQSGDMNAFAAGSSPNNAVVSFSSAIVEQMPPRELMAVAAHELAHIANRDMRRMQFATSFQNTLTWYAGFSDRAQNFIKWVLGFVAELMVKRLSRTREYWADATASAVVGGEHMVAALRRLDGDPVKPTAERLAYARMMIRPSARWFDTHPPMAERISAIESGTYISRLPYKN